MFFGRPIDSKVAAAKISPRVSNMASALLRPNRKGFRAWVGGFVAAVVLSDPPSFVPLAFLTAGFLALSCFRGGRVKAHRHVFMQIYQASSLCLCINSKVQPYLHWSLALLSPLAFTSSSRFARALERCARTSWLRIPETALQLPGYCSKFGSFFRCFGSEVQSEEAEKREKRER